MHGEERPTNISPDSAPILRLKADLLSEFSERMDMSTPESVIGAESNIARQLDSLGFYSGQLDEKLTIEKQPYEINPLSPTPADPFNIVAGDRPYFESAEELMQQRFDDKADQVNLDSMSRNSIKREISTQHMMQSTKNAEGYNRLRLAVAQDPSRLTDELAGIIPDVRSGLASSKNRLLLLSSFPEMVAIEDMKYTCPLDIKGYQRAMRTYVNKLRELQFSAGLDFFVLSNDEAKARSINVSESADSNIMVIKSVMGELFFHNSVFELVEKRSYYSFPTNPQLRGITENIIKLLDEEARNIQPISVSVYIRHKQSEPKDPESSDIYFVNGSAENAFGKHLTL